MNRRTLTLLSIVVALWLSSARIAADPVLDERGTAAIDRVLEAEVGAGAVAGVVALVTTKDEFLYVKAFGQRDVAKRIPMSTDTIFRIASMTKPVTSVGIMMLYEQGRLRLDDPVSAYLPAYKGREVLASFNEKDATFTVRPAKGEMTVRQLLTHTAGLAYPFTSSTVAAIQTAKGTDPKAMPLMWDPGAKWHYSPATGVLGELIERISYQSLEEWDQARIFRPLAMLDTTYTPNANEASRLTTIHQREATGLVETANLEPYVPDIRGDGGLVSTATDYGNFVQMLLNEGRWRAMRLLRPQTVRMMMTNQIGPLAVETMPAALPRRSAEFPFGAGKDKFGFGFQIASTDGGALNERSAGSASWGGLYNTHFWVDPKRGIGGVILMQVLPFYNATSMDVVKRFEHAVYQNLH